MIHHLRKNLCCKRNKIFQYLFKEKVKKKKLYQDQSYFFYKTVFQVPPTKKWEDKRFAHAQDKTTKCAQSGRAQLKAAAITENYGGSCIPGLHSAHSSFFHTGRLLLVAVMAYNILPSLNWHPDLSKPCVLVRACTLSSWQG